LQSFEWGEFQEGFSKKVWRVAVLKENKIVLAVQVIKEKMKFKSYFYIPYGPVLADKNDSALLDLLLDSLKDLAKKEEAVFLRIEPAFPLPQTKVLLRSASKRLQPQRTLLLDLERGEEEILQSFDKRTRYNIKLAQKKGVQVRVLENYTKDFYKLLSKTKERQEFRSYPEAHYERLMSLNGDLKPRIFLAELDGEAIVATLAIFFGNTVTTLHTGFDYCHRALKAPYLVRWSIMQEGKRLGKKWCDFWGIDEKKWPGVTRLKRSFNGIEVECGEGKEMVFSPAWYLLYNIVREIL
jgi:lipid II:glycine glycyltransferase (peptidoglycan interpeptide bridge formation enzyme)